MHSRSKELYLQLNERIIERYETTGEQPGCRKRPDLFFPEDNFTLAERESMQDWAKQLCGQCPVVNLCAEYAITAKETAGIWGGLTSWERLEISRKR